MKKQALELKESGGDITQATPLKNMTPSQVYLALQKAGWIDMFAKRKAHGLLRVPDMVTVDVGGEVSDVGEMKLVIDNANREAWFGVAVDELITLRLPGWHEG